MRFDVHAVDIAAKLEDAQAFVATGDYDLILLENLLPDGDGRSFLAEHRAINLDTPVIILTARSQVSDRIGSLDLGADDYVTKPFDHAELEARCRADLRRKAGNTRSTIEIGGTVFDPVARHLSLGGARPSPYATANCACCGFTSTLKASFFKQKLADRLFPYDNDVSENAIEVYVGRLRKHLERSNLTITTLRGLWYRLERNG